MVEIESPSGDALLLRMSSSISTGDRFACYGVFTYMQSHNLFFPFQSTKVTTDEEKESRRRRRRRSKEEFSLALSPCFFPASFFASSACLLFPLSLSLIFSPLWLSLAGGWWLPGHAQLLLTEEMDSPEALWVRKWTGQGLPLYPLPFTLYPLLLHSQLCLDQIVLCIIFWLPLTDSWLLTLDSAVRVQSMTCLPLMTTTTLSAILSAFLCLSLLTGDGFTAVRLPADGQWQLDPAISHHLLRILTLEK